MAAWPTTFPVALSEGYGIAPGDQGIRTDMEAGYARQRRRTSQRTDSVQATFLLDESQMSEFRTWFDGDCQGGAAWFTGLLLDVGDGPATYTARFAAPWTAAQAWPYWRVTATLDIRDA